MPDPDPRPRYYVLQPLTPKTGRLVWVRIGVAYRNPNGTIDAHFDAIVLSDRFRLREVLPDEDMLSAPGAKASDPELLS